METEGRIIMAIIGLGPTPPAGGTSCYRNGGNATPRTIIVHTREMRPRLSIWRLLILPLVAPLSRWDKEGYICLWIVLVDGGRRNFDQIRRSSGAWLGKPRVANDSYLWTAAGGIPTSFAVPSARGLASLETLRIHTCGRWRVELRPASPFPWPVAWQASSRKRFLLVDGGRWNSDQIHRSLGAWLGKPRVASDSYLWTVEFRPVSPLPRRVAWQDSVPLY
ncbi:hypothetical protein AVEN_147312-1 [Araneus ventricosus]|uniref:Uncharacterized protein n=1 Tax=Araneus ventricosus TaxID=182803 RepID=A0A4Y2KXH1_ARAVE|nr:hypothetical protein AVEN_147312-1 [Araneus ventricosus]